jgi:tetratricopeptide (TPR) repeat protein
MKKSAMKQLILLISTFFIFILPTSAQIDLNQKLSSYYAFQNEGNDTAAYGVLKDVYVAMRDNPTRDIDILDRYIKTAESFLTFFTPCTPEEEEEKGVNACNRITFEINQINSLLLPEGHSMRAEAKLTISDFIGALSDYDAAIKLKGDVASYYTNRGNVKYRLKDNEGALLDFDKSISIEPANASVYYNKAMVLMRNKDYPNAIGAFTKCLQYDKTNTKAMLFKGIAEYSSDNREAATTTFNELIVLEPANSDAFYYLGMIQIKNKDFAAARASLEKSVAADEKNDKAWHFLGVSTFNLQDKESACKAWSKAKELGYDKSQKMLDEHCKVAP